MIYMQHKMYYKIKLKYFIYNNKFIKLKLHYTKNKNKDKGKY